ncbi:efflux transporter outer membrane subunit [Chitinibacter tainanensis]|uniref:efflux transporter outer membrane subunit n=1 Tax=Chitinibacter tainanensis TaxID=230667 RepID=UPI0003F5BEBE|nr:efflux transporter outer membrane subunit [Chitinibacter tainanensis]
MTRTILSLLLAAALGGCASLAPDYQRPASPVAEQLTGGYTATGQEIKAPEAYTHWEQLFVEPQLQGLIRAALLNNRDYRIAALNVEKVRAQYQISDANRWPTLGLTAGSSAQGPTSGDGGISRQYSAKIGLSSYELDFFGRVKSLNNAALAQYLASQAGQQSLRLTLIAEVANAYYTLAADQATLRQVEATLQSRNTANALIEKRFAVGVIGELDVQQSRGALAAARNDQARYQALVQQDWQALQQLVGGALPLQALPDEWQNTLAATPMPAELPSAVLLRRPDVQQAEYALQAANANIGAARAAFFPSITLTANAGFSSDRLSQLFQSGSGVWLFAPQLNLPIFDGGRNQANLDIAKADRDIALAQYEQAIQTAFREVNDGLTRARTDELQWQSQREQVQIAQRALQIAEARYQRGVGAYLDVLESQRALYAAEQQLIAIRLQQVQNRVKLYKATALY